MDMVEGLMSEKDMLVLRLNGYKVSEQVAIIETMRRSLKQLERKMRTFQDEINLIQKTNTKMMGTNSEHKMAVRRTS